MEKREAIWASRRLIRAARAGSLGTSDQGQPFVSLVTPATAPDLSVLLLLSDLSSHTRHLKAEPRCGILIAGETENANPQMTPRVTLTGRADAIDDTALKARYLALHPYARLYADFADFHLWRLTIEEASYVGGFGQAARLKQTELLPDRSAVAAIAQAETSIITHCNNDHPDALRRIAGGQGDWHVVAVDVDGCDMAQAEQVRRIDWSTPVSDEAGVRRELAALSNTGG